MGNASKFLKIAVSCSQMDGAGSTPTVWWNAASTLSSSPAKETLSMTLTAQQPKSYQQTENTYKILEEDG